ncbi:MAG: restriction endonuclease [Lachnospiraceae bacterium]|nr:restriction endonuclease [Lachnospiraceae bacterium]
MSRSKYITKEEILVRGREAIGIPMRDIDKTNRLKTGKGAIGTVLEESWFGLKVNNESEPDFVDAGIELKATPYVKKRIGIRAKERLVCNIINYIEEYKNSFFTSSFWKKCNTMLLMSYEYKEDIDKGDFHIEEATLFSFPEEDLVVIEHDWEIIINKVRNGKAHELSEGDTLYLGACTKGSTSAKSMRQQPFSDEFAKQRAYALKQSYMTYILNSYIFGSKSNERIIKDPNLLKETCFEDYIIDKINPFIGRTQHSLLKEFNIESSAKNINEILLSRILGVKGRISATDEFKKAGIIPKTIRINQKGRINESMSFPTFRFLDIINENWEESCFKNYLEPARFLFVVFRKISDKEYIFERIKFWNIPADDLDEVKKVWERTKQVIKDGVVLTKTGSSTKNNFPKSTENRVSHVRPHARNVNDTYPLPDGRKMPKQCFWFNRTYIESIIEE